MPGLVLRRVTRDVDHLVAATRDASADGLPATMPVTALAETGVLAQAFGEMVLRLRQSLLTIRNQNDQFAQLNATGRPRRGVTTQLRRAEPHAHRRDPAPGTAGARAAAHVAGGAEGSRGQGPASLAILSHELHAAAGGGRGQPVAGSAARLRRSCRGGGNHRCCQQIAADADRRRAVVFAVGGRVGHAGAQQFLAARLHWVKPSAVVLSALYAARRAAGGQCRNRRYRRGFTLIPACCGKF